MGGIKKHLKNRLFDFLLAKRWQKAKNVRTLYFSKLNPFLAAEKDKGKAKRYEKREENQVYH